MAKHIHSHKELLSALNSSGGVQISRNGSTYNTRNTATEKSTIESLEAALVHLHTVFHLASLYNTEYGVFNPSPSQPTGDYVFPADLFLSSEAEKMAAMDLKEFVKYTKKLIAKKNIPAISVTGGVNKKNTEHYTIQFLFSKAIVSALNGNYLCMESVAGGPCLDNKRNLTKVQKEICNALAEIPDEALIAAMC